jgi:hypothetical protein
MIITPNLRSAPLWDITQRVATTPYRRFGTTYRSQIQGSRNPRRNNQEGIQQEYQICIGEIHIFWIGQSM